MKKSYYFALPVQGDVTATSPDAAGKSRIKMSYADDICQYQPGEPLRASKSPSLRSIPRSTRQKPYEKKHCYFSCEGPVESNHSRPPLF